MVGLADREIKNEAILTEPTRLDVIGKKLQTRNEKAEILVNKPEQELQRNWLNQGQI